MRSLEGVRVLDLTQAYSGPFCTMHLADHGAEVIKVELPGTGDQSRTWAPFKNGYSGYYAYINRNKQGITLNLKTAEGRAVLKELVQKSDVLCENFRVGTMEKLGLDYPALCQLNPRLIYGSISGFGLDGALAPRPCYDIVAQAMSGMMDVTGFPDQACVKTGPSIGDNYSGTYLALGIVMALFQRERTGKGQRLDVSMLDSLFSVMENFIIQYTITGATPRRRGNIDPGIAPFDCYPASDGSFVLGCGTDRFWRSLCELMDRRDLLSDPRYQTNALRCENYLPDLKNAVCGWTRRHTMEELERMVTAAGIPCSRIYTVAEAADQDQIARRHMLWMVQDPGIGEAIDIPGTPIKMHGQPDAPRCAAPTLGQDTSRILRSLLGYSEEKLRTLAACGAI